MELKIKRNATVADLEQVPEGHNGQLIDGVLYITSRPAIPHAIAITGLVNELTPFRKNRALGWILLFEPVLLMGPNVLIGDISGWRRDRLPKIPEGKWFEIAPDFVCEGLSPSTARIDRGQKREIYAKAGVSYLWFVDPANRTLEALALKKSGYHVVAVGGDEKGRFPPFDQIEIDLATLWEP